MATTTAKRPAPINATASNAGNTTMTKPKLAVSTPMTATFPSNISSKSPLSAKPKSAGPSRTPISPPVAYTDFLRFMNINSPATCRISVLSGESTPASMPSTATTAPSDCSCKVEFQPEFKTPMTAPAVPPSPFTMLPMSAPPTGQQVFPSLKIPPSPAVSNYESPVSAYSPFSAKTNTKFDWEAALKARKLDQARKAAAKSTARTVRHIREVVTRTVTYTPRIAPAPKSKRRKISHETEEKKLKEVKEEVKED